MSSNQELIFEGRRIDDTGYVCAIRIHGTLCMGYGKTPQEALKNAKEWKHKQYRDLSDQVEMAKRRKLNEVAA